MADAAAELAAWGAPDGPLAGTCIARIDLPATRCPAGIGGPTPVVLRPDGAYDLLPFGPTVADLLERTDLLALAARTDLRRVADLAELVGSSPAEARRPDVPAFLAPFDLQVVRACGVTFAESLIERVIEEGARGDAARARELRGRLTEAIGADLGSVRPGSEGAMALKRELIASGLWSQYLEVGIGPDAEIFTKTPVLASMGHGERIGVRRDSAWNNPEPEVVLAVTPDGRIVGATLGNDVNLRDFEGRSALLLPEAKDNNASCAIGPAIRLFDARFTLDTLMATDVELEVRGRDGFVTGGRNRLSRISRDPRDLVAQAIGRTHQYPDGLALFLGTMFVPTADRGAPGSGFTHHEGDVVTIANPHLGVLRNSVGWCDDLPPWSGGIRAFRANVLPRAAAAAGR
ncbi:MAG: fumarylacetoacetate hydrolase family protein [Chloroflexota bacterium]